jgi:hypothetical protein
MLYHSMQERRLPGPHTGRDTVVWALGPLLIALACSLPALADERLSVLKVGSEVYSNVTVTTVTATSILFNHAQGMGSAKLKDLDPELQEHFHFDSAKAAQTEQSQRKANAQVRARMLKSPVDTVAGPAIQGLPFRAVPVNTAESQERNRIRAGAWALLKAKDFASLDELARDYRRTRQSFPDGTWYLGELYAGMQPPPSKPSSVWMARVALLEEWTKARPESITPRVALANLMLAYAWKARGTGDVHSVSTNGLGSFASRALQGISLMQESAGLKEHCPYERLPVLLAARGIGARKEEFYRPLFDALAAEPTFIPYYEQAVLYQLPRWFGASEDAAEVFLQQQADKLGGEEGDVLYARLAWRMQSSGLFSDAIKECHFSWERVDKGFQVLERRYPEALSVRSAHAWLGGLAAGPEVVRALLKRLDGRVDLSVWNPVDQFKERARNAYALK